MKKPVFVGWKEDAIKFLEELGKAREKRVKYKRDNV